MGRKHFLTRFFAVFFAIYIGYFALSPSFIENTLASLEVLLLQAANINAVVDGNRIILSDGIFLINQSCVGMVSLAMLFGLIAGSKNLKPKNKLKVGFFGAGSLLIINFFRIFSIVLVGDAYSLGLAELMHIVTWFIMAGGVIALWYFLALRFEGHSDISKVVV